MAIQPDATLNWFKWRLRSVFPVESGLITIDEPERMEAVLRAVLRFPLQYDPEEDGLPPDVLWWFRGHASYQIRGYDYSSADQVLTLHTISDTSDDVLHVVGVDVLLDDRDPDLNFVHLRCGAMQPVVISQQEVQNGIERHGYISEEVVYLVDEQRYIYYPEYEHEPYYHKQPIRHQTRYLSAYNRFLAPKEGRLNNTGQHGTYLQRLCDLLLHQELSLAAFISRLAALPPSRYKQRLIERAEAEEWE